MLQIQEMAREHAGAVLEMMRVFYASPALLTKGSEAIFSRDIAACVQGSPYLEGYVFLDGAQVAGYAMLAKSFSTEFGRPCVWIEDLYLKPPYRGQGTAGRFFSLIAEKYPQAVFRLEAEAENTPAIRAYEKSGFRVLPYTEMIWLQEHEAQE